MEPLEKLVEKWLEGPSLTRRQFLKASGAAVTLLALGEPSLGLLKYAEGIENPLAHYPNRDWEKVYRDIYRYDSSFTFVCSPNDTHACRLRAFVRNGIVVRIEQAYDADKVKDLDGNKICANWNPRGCLKGYTMMRRVYGPYRVKSPMVRAGWKKWVKAGFPMEPNGLPKRVYFRRGEDAWEKVSWEEAQTLVARVVLHLMEKYGGEEGAALLKAQGYPVQMIEAMDGSGAQTIKCRAGMWLCGILQIGAIYRFANLLGFYDGRHGGRNWTNYDWHGDLPPGHPMVTGIQTFDPDLDDFRRAKLLIFVGKNMVENKMADAHWWIEAMERGAKIVNISPEYSPASQKADYWIPIRPGSDVALLLGVSMLLIERGLYDAEFVKQFSDLPLLVRTDTLKLLRASEVIRGYQNAKLTGYSVQVQKINPKLRETWGDFVVWDSKSASPKAITRDEVGKPFLTKGIDPALAGSFKIKTVDGQAIDAKPIFQIYKELLQEYDLDTVADITQAPKELIERLAQDLATLKPAMLHTGEGINHYFHCDLTTRAVFLPMILTGNIGRPGGNVGHWAGNYKSAVFPGLGVYLFEDPFSIDRGKQKKFASSENVAYWNYGDRPLAVNGKCFTGKTHMPTPTKMIWAANVNLLNNAKWAYQMIANVDPKIEAIVYNEIEWTASCEYADVVFPAESWLELTQPNFTASCSNPFLQVWQGGIKPVYDSKPDGLIVAGVAQALSEITGNPAYREYFKYYLEGKPLVYAQRIFDASSTTKGYNAEELLKSEHGWLMQFRTTPRIPAWEQIQESKPFYTKTGRMELYREEDEFIEAGENLIVHREPVEATPYLPNVIVATHSSIRPNDHGIPLDSMGADERSVRNVKLPWEKVRQTVNPLWGKGYRFWCLTPKTRHRVHSSWSVCDWNLIWDSNFGDPSRSDKRTPGVGEHQIHINPEDAKALGINDGDYVYVDANPEDRPYVGWRSEDFFYKVSRCMLRARYNPAYPRGVVMIKHGPFMATHKSVRAHETRADHLARAEDTGYQANLRYGSQQSLTRAWLQPTMMTDSLVRKELYGQAIGTGYAPDIHSPNTCPKETLVKITKAEEGRWEPAKTGLTPGQEDEAMKLYLQGEYLT